MLAEMVAVETSIDVGNIFPFFSLRRDIPGGGTFTNCVTNVCPRFLRKDTFLDSDEAQI